MDGQDSNLYNLTEHSNGAGQEIRVEKIMPSKVKVGVYEGFQYQYVRSKTSNVIGPIEPFNEFYVYLLKVKYEFTPANDDHVSCLRDNLFKNVTRNEEECRVYHVHYQDEDISYKLPYKWLQNLIDGYWQYTISELDFIKLVSTELTPLDEYLSYGLSH